MSEKNNQSTDLQGLLKAVAAGTMSAGDAERELNRLHIADMGFAALDLHREARRGRPEVILCENKTPQQVLLIARRLRQAGQNVMMTRLTAEQEDAVLKEFQNEDLHHEPVARFLAVFQRRPEEKSGLVGVLAAGTSDLPVAEEAACTAEALGSPVERAYDVGVAGVHRLMRKADLLVRARVLVVVAGMEGALPGIVSGLTRVPVIAVPTSVGYGASFHGLSALLTMINGCSPGVSVVNIDNGFGAGYLADQINEIGEGSGMRTADGG